MQIRESIPDLSGATGWLHEEIKNEDIRQDMPTLIHFWSVSCDACIKNMPLIQSLQSEHQESLQVIAVHMPRSEKDKNLDSIVRKSQEYHMMQPIAIDDQHTLSKRFSVRHVPAYFLFDGNGQLRYKQASGSGRMLKKRIDRFVELAKIEK